MTALSLARAGLTQDEQTLPWSDLPPLPPSSGTAIRFTDLAALRGFTVPNDQFFVLQHGGVPQLDRNRFRLRIEGELERAVELSFDDIEAMSKKELTVCFECAGNAGVGSHGLVGNALWGGTPLVTLLRELGIRPRAREVVFYGADVSEERLRGNSYPARFARSLPVADALDEDVLLAYEMNGEALSAEHGFPLRLVVPGWYGVAHVKWLERIEVVDHRFMGRYMSKEYVTLRGARVDGEVVHRATSVGRQKLKSVIARVTRRPNDRYIIHGFGWNDGSEIESIEVRIDDGPFVPAELERPGSRFAWTPFRREWTRPEKGLHRLVSRAVDASHVQPTTEDASMYKATPWENNGQVERAIEIPG
jgi:DMSO/TMAO reductase YedYZ molybdopterin-dependent catalytic subunit